MRHYEVRYTTERGDTRTTRREQLREDEIDERLRQLRELRGFTSLRFFPINEATYIRNTRSD